MAKELALEKWPSFLEKAQLAQRKKEMDRGRGNPMPLNNNSTGLANVPFHH